MKRRDWILRAAAGATAALAAAGCGKRFWEPTREQMAEAEAIAKFHVLQHLSDQAGSATVAAVKTDASGLPAEYPIAFTIGQTPYARFRMKYWGGKVQGVKVVHVEYFDPTRLPDWEQSEEFKEPYPGHFTVAVDLAARRVVDATKKP